MNRTKPSLMNFMTPSGHFHRFVRRGDAIGCFECGFRIGTHGEEKSHEGKLYSEKVWHMVSMHCPDGGDRERHVKEYPFECIGPTAWDRVRVARKWRKAYRKIKLIMTLLRHGQAVNKRLARKRLREAAAARTL